MASSWGTRGEDGKNLIRDMKTFKDNLSEIDFSKREAREPTKVRPGKKTYGPYGVK